jgi:Kef-type K+ transport system membrane component KefB
MVILGVGVLLFLASLFIALFRRTRVPDVLLLIGLGLLLGPVTRSVGPQAFGEAGRPSRSAPSWAARPPRW